MRSCSLTTSQAIPRLMKAEGLAPGGGADTTATAALGTMLAVTAILTSGTVLLTRAATAFGSMRRGAGERDEAARREKVNRERSNRRFIKWNRAKQYSPKRRSYSKREKQAILVAEHSYIGTSANQYCSNDEPVLVRRRSYIASYRYAVVLPRHHTRSDITEK